MNTQVIRAGDIQELTIDNIAYPVPEDTDCEIVFTADDRTAMVNEVTNCTANTIIVYGKKQKAGIYGITLAMREDLMTHFANMRDSGNAYPVLLTLASGTSFYGELAVANEYKMKTKDHTGTVDLLGLKFEKM